MTTRSHHGRHADSTYGETAAENDWMDAQIAKRTAEQTAVIEAAAAVRADEARAAALRSIARGD